MKVLAAILVSLAGSAICPAALEWKTTSLQLTAQPGQQDLAAVFPFRNAGAQPVRILALDPSCSCLSASPDKAVCPPGGTGEIRIDLGLAGYSGRVRRSVAVTTDAADGKFAELLLTVDIPELATIAPRFLVWRVGDHPIEKTVDVVVADPKTTTVGPVECTNPHFHARLTAGEAGAYRLAVAPTDTRQPDEVSLELNLTVGGRSQAYFVYAAVK